MDRIKNFKEKYQALIRKQNKTNNYLFLKDKFKRGKLCCNLYKLSEVDFENLISILSIFNKIFKDRWDLDVEPFVESINGIKSFKLNVKGIFIYFPIIEIQNSKGNTHTIKDLFLEVEFCKESQRKHIYINYINGFRSTLTLKEVVSGYSHSHINSPIRYLLKKNQQEMVHYVEKTKSTFCLGEGPIVEIIDTLNSSLLEEDKENKEEVKDLIFLLCSELINIAGWESLEGTPYIYMSHIKYQASSKKRFTFSELDIKRTIKNILDNYWKDKIDELQLGVNISLKGYFEVVDFGNIFSCLEEEEFKKLKEYIYAIEENGAYYNINDFENNMELKDLSVIKPFIFRGKDYPMIVEMPEQEITEKDIKTTIPEAVRKTILKELTNRLNNGLYNKGK